MTVWEGKFIIGISGERDSASEVDKNKLLELIENIHLVSPAQMDQYLGLPIPKNQVEELEERAFQNSDLEGMANIKRNFSSQFSYFSYFNILSSMGCWGCLFGRPEGADATGARWQRSR